MRPAQGYPSNDAGQTGLGIPAPVLLRPPGPLRPGCKVEKEGEDKSPPLEIAWQLNQTKNQNIAEAEIIINFS